jgi:hypothetical protein
VRVVGDDLRPVAHAPAAHGGDEVLAIGQGVSAAKAPVAIDRPAGQGGHQWREARPRQVAAAVLALSG